MADQLVWSDPHARVTELAFSSRALLPPQTSPDRGLLVVVSGGGWVQVGDERTAIHHGEAVELPPGVAHGAWTDGSTMRVILVEVPDSAMERITPDWRTCRGRARPRRDEADWPHARSVLTSTTPAKESPGRPVAYEPPRPRTAPSWPSTRPVAPHTRWPATG